MAERCEQLNVAEREHAAELDAVPDRRRVRDQLERERQLRDREERPREQEHRHDHEAEDRDEAASSSRVAAMAAIGIENAVPISTATGTTSSAEPGGNRAEGRDDREIGGGRDSTRVNTNS